MRKYIKLFNTAIPNISFATPAWNQSCYHKYKALNLSQCKRKCYLALAESLYQLHLKMVKLKREV